MTFYQHWTLAHQPFFDVGYLCRVRHNRSRYPAVPYVMFTGDALDWFRSYLTGRIQRVVIEDAVSVDKEIGFGVPQGSVLGPKIYCMYSKPVSGMYCLIILMHMTPSYI